MQLEILQNAMKYYEGMDDGHGPRHIQQVLENMTKLINIVEKRENIKLDKNLMYTAVLYHDTGNKINRKEHHLISGQIVRNEQYLRKYFTEEEIETIARMCEEHRSSRKEACSGIREAMLNDADSINTFEDMVERSYKYHMKHDEDKSYEVILRRVHEHLKEKFGRGGYSSYRTQYTNEIINIEERYEILENEDKFREVFNKIVLKNKE